MITSYPIPLTVYTLGTLVVVKMVPVHGPCRIRASVWVSALVGAPSIVFDLYNDDAMYNNVFAGAGPLTKVLNSAGVAVTTAAIVAAGLVDISTGYTADCREAVDLVFTNNVAATGFSVQGVITVTETV